MNVFGNLLLPSEILYFVLSSFERKSHIDDVTQNLQFSKQLQLFVIRLRNFVKFRRLWEI